MAEQKKQTDLQKISEFVELMIANNLLELEIVNGDSKIHLKRPQPQQPAVTPSPVIAPAAAAVPLAVAAQPAPGEVQEQQLLDIKSPLVGTFYAAASPDSKPYVQVGSEVEPDTVVCIVEAMKVMNEIKAEVTGTIVKVLVATGQAVEYGQVLFRVRPQ
jgi:acetyl-CoA carboxylase biotin carboxyl carrier protein